MRHVGGPAVLAQVLEDPGVTQLVEQDQRVAVADVDAGALGAADAVPEQPGVAPAGLGVGVEGDAHRRQLQAGLLVGVQGLVQQFLLLGVGTDGDDDGRAVVDGVLGAGRVDGGCVGGAGDGGDDGEDEVQDGVHACTVENRAFQAESSRSCH